jgi:glucokinase
MRLATAKILCGIGLFLICASAFFITTRYDLDGRREWTRCEQERHVHQRGVYSRSPRCLELEDRFKTGLALVASGLVLIFVARPGSRAREAARSRGA